jgi:transcriptional regulator with XRE-family HTH domain
MDLRGMDAGQVAAALGISAAPVSRWLRGTTKPSRDNALALARVLGVSVEYLLGGPVSLPGRVRPHLDALLGERAYLRPEEAAELAAELMEIVAELAEVK